MNKDKQNYNKLKKYWKLLLKDHTAVDFDNYTYHRCFKNQMRQIDIINYLLDLDSELRASYKLYQNIRYCIKHRDFDLLVRTLNGNITQVSNYMKTSVRTIKKYLEYVNNTLKYDYNNGVLEGLNNKIKVIKRIAFGYRCFYHFKNRILITQGLARLKTA